MTADARTHTKIETKSISPHFGVGPTGANKGCGKELWHWKDTATNSQSQKWKKLGVGFVVRVDGLGS